MTTSTSIFEFKVGSLAPRTVTRPEGQICLDIISPELARNQLVVLNFLGVEPTPSFADQCIGGLVTRLGLDGFKRQIKLTNVSDSAKPLIRYVILSRAPGGRLASKH